MENVGFWGPLAFLPVVFHYPFPAAIANESFVRAGDAGSTAQREALSEGVCGGHSPLIANSTTVFLDCFVAEGVLPSVTLLP
jgi:hypothetical protein